LIPLESILHEVARNIGLGASCCLVLSGQIHSGVSVICIDNMSSKGNAKGRKSAQSKGGSGQASSKAAITTSLSAPPLKVEVRAGVLSGELYMF
jgi:hypothetical protein